MTRITGQQARDLLEGATSGPWEWYPDNGIVSLKSSSGGPVATDLNVVDCDLMAAAPDLAETITWLNGRHQDRVADDGTEWHWKDQTILTSRGAGALAMFKGNFIGYDDEMTPDEAVDLARALLAAAQEARK